jgi:hypothetical protein
VKEAIKRELMAVTGVWSLSEANIDNKGEFGVTMKACPSLVIFNTIVKVTKVKHHRKLQWILTVTITAIAHGISLFVLLDTSVAGLIFNGELWSREPERVILYKIHSSVHCCTCNTITVFYLTEH